ncbi:rod shape-determining protein MreD [Roseinatronobacter bogoriensis subsp. barguzinensis]|uniref:Rod shape-determining protein MreD n=2 Tax=Roseinatronobacter bogoriensis TaxID=119542 RepID=A0A2K8KAH2_9RHOB|nr:rod shape-determining protein MreD [Rhodobaca barguzinensis]MBB4207594.1 rod shape-determining protein MreD [Rhodobaca bogoriensis DSM 18756]
MVERRQTQMLLYVALFLGVAALITFYRLLPLGSYGLPQGLVGAEDISGEGTGFSLRNLPPPDILLCLTLAWVVRRPDLLPAPIIVGYFFIEDILLLRPPGLWALIVLMGSEFLRTRTEQLRGYGFWLEFLLVIGLLLAMFLANRAMLAIVMVPQVPLGLSFAQFLGTVAIYPAVVALSHFVFRLRKPATGEVDALGQRL